VKGLRTFGRFWHRCQEKQSRLPLGFAARASEAASEADSEHPGPPPVVILITKLGVDVSDSVRRKQRVHLSPPAAKRVVTHSTETCLQQSARLNRWISQTRQNRVLLWQMDAARGRAWMRMRVTGRIQEQGVTETWERVRTRWQSPLRARRA
jgi:hypothetical protein